MTTFMSNQTIPAFCNPDMNLNACTEPCICRPHS